MQHSEAVKKNKLLLEYFELLDNKYADYFADQPDNLDSVRKYFFVINDFKLRYLAPLKLRTDILELAVAKHKELYGDHTDYEVLTT